MIGGADKKIPTFSRLLIIHETTNISYKEKRRK
jgi:hypothetical protein